VGPAYFLAIGSAVLYGAADFTGGVATRRASTTAVVVLSQSCGLVLIALLLPLLPHAEPSRADLLWGAAAGLTGGIGVALLYHALAIGSMTVVAPTTAVCAVTIPAGVSILLGERPAPLAVAGILLGIASIVLVSRQPVDPAASRTEPPRFLPRGVGIALISGVAIGLFLLTFAQTRPQAGMWPLLAARVVSVSLFAVIVLVRRGSLRMPARVAGLSLAGGAVDMLANALYLVAARLGPLSVVVTLSSLYPASTVLLARAILGERLGRWQILGVGCALTAIVLIIGGSR
jgi:drug/metabolite transporter (DMT)-like permease